MYKLYLYTHTHTTYGSVFWRTLTNTLSHGVFLRVKAQIPYGARISQVFNKFSFLSPLLTPPQKKVTGSPLIRQVLQANWLCPLGFVGEPGKGVEGEKVTRDGLSHRKELPKTQKLKSSVSLAVTWPRSQIQPQAGCDSTRGESSMPSRSHFK